MHVNCYNVCVCEVYLFDGLHYCYVPQSNLWDTNWASFGVHVSHETTQDEVVTNDA